MAFVAPAIISSGTGTLGATHTTGTYTPGANTCQLIAGCAYKDGGVTCNKPTISDTAGHTWTELVSKHTSDNTTKDMWIVLWASDTTGASPAGRTITISSTSATGCMLIGNSVRDFDWTGVTVQTAVGEDLSAGDPAFTFGSAPGANNLAFGVVFGSGTGLHTPPTGFTELSDTTVLTSHKLENFYDLASAATGPNTPTSANTRSISVAVELEAAPSITVPVSKVAGTGAATNTHTTASFTPNANTRMIVTCGAFSTGTISAKPTISDSVGHTWTEVANIHTSDAVTTDMWINQWYSEDVGASPAALTVTVGATGATTIYCVVATLVAAEITVPPIQTDTGEQLTTGDADFTFANPTAGKSLIYAVAISNGDNGMAPPATFTEQVDSVSQAVREIESYYRNGGIATGPHALSTINGRGIVVAAEWGVAGAGGVTLTPALYTNVSSFPTPVVTPGDVTLQPDLFTNTQSFPAEVTKLFVNPNLATNISAYFVPVVTVGAVTLLPNLFTNAQSYPSAVVSPGPVSLLPALYANLQTFYSPSVSQVTNLVASLFTNAQTYFTHVLSASKTLTPALFTNANSFFTHVITASYNLQPNLYTNVQIFYSPVVTLGGVAIQPALFTNQQSFPSATVSLAGSAGHKEWESISFLIDTGWL